eukprot:3671075-Pyramimonas_sp.AAC.1
MLTPRVVFHEVLIYGSHTSLIPSLCLLSLLFVIATQFFEFGELSNASEGGTHDNFLQALEVDTVAGNHSAGPCASAVFAAASSGAPKLVPVDSAMGSKITPKEPLIHEQTDGDEDAG